MNEEWMGGDWVPINSTAIRQAKWTAERQLLEVELQTGYVYAYDVDEAVVRQFFESASRGTYYNQVLRRRYGERQIGRA